MNRGREKAYISSKQRTSPSTEVRRTLASNSNIPDRFINTKCLFSAHIPPRVNDERVKTDVLHRTRQEGLIVDVARHHGTLVVQTLAEHAAHAANQRFEASCLGNTSHNGLINDVAVVGSVTCTQHRDGNLKEDLRPEFLTLEDYSKRPELHVKTKTPRQVSRVYERTWPPRPRWWCFSRDS